MSNPVLSNLLNELRKRYQMRGLLAFYRRNEFNKFTKLQDFIYHMTLKNIPKSRIKMLRVCHICSTLLTIMTIDLNIAKCANSDLFI